MLRVLKQLATIASEAVAPDSAKVGNVPAGLSMLLLTTSSIILIFLPLNLLIIAVMVLLPVAAIIKGFRETAAISFLWLMFVIPYVTISVGVQLVLRSFLLNILLLGIARMYALMLVGTVTLSLINVHEFALELRKLSPTLGIALALSIKFFYSASVNLARLTDTYSINLGVKSLRGEVLRATAIAKALTYVTTVSALESVEAIYTRLSPLLYGVCNEEGGTKA